jgi:hypothetical protein
MPGLSLFNKTGFYSHIGANRFIPTPTIKLGSTRGAGSSTRIFKNVKREFGSAAALNEFINVTNPSAGGNIPGPEPGPEPGPCPECPDCPPTDVFLESIATKDNNGNWVLNGNTTIRDFEVLSIQNGMTFIIPPRLTLTNDGTINNSGTIQNSGTLINNGAINNNNFGLITNNTDGTIDNNCIINNNNGGIITNNGEIANNSYGIFNNNKDGIVTNNDRITNSSDGIFNNDGIITNSQVIVNSGIM